QERKRRLRPWLYDGTPQKHSRDPYWFDVTYNQMFKKSRYERSARQC
ncbi:SA1788 family PVL leukocidin-associated protein, partial [Staphylococcus aureus]|nr:SA1788 family PVL leukocidin-associated protein [Staphylococcus aureus]MDM5646950.1 SA1788 family PVL leukocidin-associated protein [Staphylococcus aureus]